MKPPFLFAILSIALAGCIQNTESGAGGSPNGKAAAPAETGKGGTTSRPSGTADATKKDAPKKDAPKKDAPTSQPTKKVSAAPKPDGAPRLDEKVYKHFGAGVAAAGDTITLATLASKATELDGKKVRVSGDVKSVCKAKGCWMVLADDKSEVRIKFKDYAFFVPKDCEGQTAVLEGTFSVSQTSVAELKHLLEDAGKHDEAAKVTEPKVEMKVMADGVALKQK